MREERIAGRLRARLLASVLLLLATAGSHAGDVAELRAAIERGDWTQADAALQALAADPPADRLEVDFLGGMMWVARGDLAAAAAAFQRVVDARPELPRPRLELARVRYLRGEDAAARAHFERVLAGPVPPAVADNIQRFLDDIRQRGAWAVDLSLAPVADDNLNGGTYRETIDLGGLSFTVAPDARAVPGHGLVAGLRARRLLPLAGAWRHELAALWQHKDYNRSAFDETYGRLGYGIRRVAGGGPLEWGGGVMVTDRRVGHQPFSGSTGWRLDARSRLGGATHIDGAFERQAVQYHATPGRDGGLIWLTAGMQHWLDPRTIVVLGIERLREAAGAPAFRLKTTGASIALYRDYGWALTAGLTGRAAASAYDEPLTLFTQRRRDQDRSLGFYLNKKDFALFGLYPALSISREWRRSSIDFFAYRRNRYQLAFERRLRQRRR